MTAESVRAFRNRISERETIERVLDDARNGRSAVLVVRGEAGVGKSALLRAVAERASGFRVAQIAGVESEMELPFAGLHQLCATRISTHGARPCSRDDWRAAAALTIDQVSTTSRSSYLRRSR